MKARKDLVPHGLPGVRKPCASVEREARKPCASAKCEARKPCASVKCEARKPCASGVKAYLKAQFREIRKNCARLECEDVDAIHDVRVASRRLRALLSEQSRWFPARSVERVQARLRDIGCGLGRARELDVSLDLLNQLCGGDVAKDGKAHAPKKRKASCRYVLRAIRDIRATESSAIRRAAALLGTDAFEQAFRALLDAHVGQSPYGPKRPARRISKRYETVLDAYATWQAQPTEEALHRLRIAFKKLRYTCETYRKCEQYEAKSAGGEVPAADRPLAGFIDELKIAQDRLGEWHDVVVLRRYLMGIVEDAPEQERPGCEAVMMCLDTASQKRLAAFAAYARRFFGKTKTVRTRALLGTMCEIRSGK